MPGWKRQLKMYGHVQSRSAANAMSDTVKPKQHHIETYKSKEQADVCLNCTKEKCRGGSTCFGKRKKEQECAKNGPSSET